MSQNAILFIPDISGFTEFVHHTSINHSRHIISELLELLIDNNTMGLELAEIEGDALFFYKMSDGSELSSLDDQIEKMYVAFHTHLKRYEYQRICQCGACSSAYNLKLKFVVHYGEIEFIKVKNSKKPYGSNVIQVHRLLKNEVPVDEYALFTESVKEIDKTQEKAITTTYDFGDISFSYNPLKPLRAKLPEVHPIPDDVPKHKLFDETEIINLPINDLYEVISNFDYRLLWNKGIDKLEYEKNKVNRVSEKHKCLFNKNDDVEVTTISKKVEQNQLVYGETTSDVPFTKRFNSYFVLEEMEDGKTKLNIEAFVDFKPFGIIMKPLLKSKLNANISESIKDLMLLIDSGFSPNETVDP
ncbi:DUF2652 domain-containing protein [Hyunsoonleella sp. SJ7]|uniref:DUF2652 domain-containing protein n=1 Tax=Hyunsoonleella aquatilis TaxID=2762758 RepID=A0A923HIE8_9FLAO|nr:DUF2652 domain-containing protein [Hyunsoonleella aquatilis]MBC3759885.1 DUF2652 domain-containing protein [Hyunsoonleella aquatilis]